VCVAVNVSTTDCLERLVSKNYHVLRPALNYWIFDVVNYCSMKLYEYVVLLWFSKSCKRSVSASFVKKCRFRFGWGSWWKHYKLMYTLRYIKVTTLSGVSYVSVYEQTHFRQWCNLFISWLWTQSVIVLPSVARACDNQSTVHLEWQLGCQFCTCTQCLRD